jgi:DNA invertase Pin-like site-specific DNA recombinase
MSERESLMASEVLRDSSVPATAGYVRDAGAQDPPAAQAEAIREFCRRRGWRLVRIYSDHDPAASGGPATGLQGLLQDARAGEIQYVVVKRLSRLGRRLGDLIAILEELTRLGVVVVSVDDNLESSETLLKLLIAVDDLSRSLRSERIKAALRAARQQGKHLGAVPVGMARGPDGRLVDVGRSALIRELRNRVRHGYSVARAARELGISYSTAWRLLRSSGDDS